MKTAFSRFGWVMLLLGIFIAAIGFVIFIIYNLSFALIAGVTLTGVGVILMLVDVALDIWGD